VQIDIPDERLLLHWLQFFPIEGLLSLEVFLLLLEPEHLLQFVPRGGLGTLFDHQLIGLWEIL
jgi:hypothetical protein